MKYDSIFQPVPQSLQKTVELLSFSLHFPMINYILLYKIRKRVKHLLKEKIADDEIATTKNSCIGCLADEISWEIYYLMKEDKATSDLK